jgi:hypothetical protein
MKHPMNHQTPFWKLALGGVIAGAALYFIPFFFAALLCFVAMSFFFRLFFGFGRWGGPHVRHAYAAPWQSMTEEQRAAMRGKSRNHRCHGQQAPTENHPSSTTSNA